MVEARQPGNPRPGSDGSGTPERSALLAYAGLDSALKRFAERTGLAVALADVHCSPVGHCHGPQAIWSTVRAFAPVGSGECPFCLGRASPCPAAGDAMRSGQPAYAIDGMGLAHVTVPLALDSEPLGVLLAGQVFDASPGREPVMQVARGAGVSPEHLWELACQQQPMTRDRLRLFGELLATLGQSIIDARHDTIVERLRAEQKRIRQARKDEDRRRSEFLSMLGHELRNPLAPLRSAIELLGQTSSGSGFDDPTLDMMGRQVRQLERLVDDLLDASRLSQGRIGLKRQRIELSDIVQQALEGARPLADSRGQRFTVSMSPESMPLVADPARLVQVFGNLLSNACKYSHSATEVRVDIGRDDHEATIRVRDSGIGLTAEELAHVFEMFTKVDRLLEKAQGGMGVGLGLVKRIVELHGGTVEAHSDGPGRGAEFIVRLPLAAEAEAAPLPRAPPAAAASIAQLRFLVVDDNRDAADSLATLLRLAGHDVDAVHDGLDAVDAAEAFQPDVVLLDLGLPELDGYGVARRIRRQQNGREVLLIAVSGWGQEEDFRRSRAAGFDAHLVKPVRFSKLIEVLAEKTAAMSLRPSDPSAVSPEHPDQGGV